MIVSLYVKSEFIIQIRVYKKPNNAVNLFSKKSISCEIPYVFFVFLLIGCQNDYASNKNLHHFVIFFLIGLIALKFM